jgi:magnesium chelatase family protein
MKITTAEQARQLMRELRDEPRHTLLLGSHHAGKTALARRIAAAQPLLTGDDLETAAWLRYGSRLRPAEHAWSPLPWFRAPHHTCSEAAMLGDNFVTKAFRPGEATIAHGGTLFLDEVGEFLPRVLNATLGAVQDGGVDLGTKRAVPRLVIGASVQCQCGYHPQPRCRCSAERLKQWNDNATERLRLDFWQRVVEVQLSPVEAGKLPKLSLPSGAYGEPVLTEAA